MRVLEKWADINGSNGYQVSTLGQVRSKRKILKVIVNKGYHTSAIYYGRKRKFVKIHRLVANAFISNPKSLQYVNHKDGVKSNNNVSNLEWTDHYSNMRHAYINGLINNSGIRCHFAKLNDEAVILIRQLLEDGLTPKSISHLIGGGITLTTIYSIKNGHTWKHVNKRST